MIISVYDFLCDLRFSGAFVWFPYEICRGLHYHPDSFKFDHLTCKQRNIMEAEAVDGAPLLASSILEPRETKQKRQVLCSQNSPQCNCWRCFKLNSYTLPDIQLYRLVACLYVSDDLYLLRFSFVTICGYK